MISLDENEARHSVVNEHCSWEDPRWRQSTLRTNRPAGLSPSWIEGNATSWNPTVSTFQKDIVIELGAQAFTSLECNVRSLHIQPMIRLYGASTEAR